MSVTFRRNRLRNSTSHSPKL